MESKIIKELLRLGAYFIIIQLFLPHPDFSYYGHSHPVEYLNKAEVEDVCRRLAVDEAKELTLDIIADHIFRGH